MHGELLLLEHFPDVVQGPFHRLSISFQSFNLYSVFLFLFFKYFSEFVHLLFDLELQLFDLFNRLFQIFLLQSLIIALMFLQFPCHNFVRFQSLVDFGLVQADVSDSRSEFTFNMLDKLVDLLESLVV